MPDDSPYLFAEPCSTPQEPAIRQVGQEDHPDDRWWLWPLPKPTNTEARGSLREYQGLLDQMDATALWEQEERRRIAAVADQAEFDLLNQITANYHAKKLTQIDLAHLYYCYREVARHGASDRWDQVVPFKTSDILCCKFNEPNADGGWAGTYPYKFGHSMPQDGQSVVYWLTDANGVDCYIGSTEKLRNRLKWHRSDGKVFVAWRAVPYPDRQATYEAEDRLLRSGPLPYLNQKVGR